jgi:hypothetical protein
MRALIIDDDVRARAAEVVAHAEANPFRPPYATAPGDDPKLTLQIGTYRCVFSRTIMGDVEFRHLSVSVPGGLYPGPEAVFLIAADLFGFTGWDWDLSKVPDDWACRPKQEPVMCVEIAQPVRATVPREQMS